MRILITGGSGFIGVHLAEQLSSAGHELTNLDLVAEHGPFFNRAWRGDVRNSHAAGLAVAGQDAVVHLAAAHHDFGIQRETYFSVNEFGTEQLCRACEQHDVRTIVFLSSVAVYGTSDAVCDEQSAVRPTSPYGESKLAAEKVLRRWADRGAGRRLIVLRPAVVYGERNFANMYSLIAQIHSRRFLEVGHGRNIKSIVYIKNLIGAIISALESENRESYQLFNAVDTPDLTSSQIVGIIYAALGRPIPRVRLPLSLALGLAVPFDAIIRLTGWNLPISSERIRKLASVNSMYSPRALMDRGFRQPFSPEQGIARMVEWFLRDGRHEALVRSVPPFEVVSAIADLSRSAPADAA
jgi:nucleoside-diphosphate-sugar epimerase